MCKFEEALEFDDDHDIINYLLAVEEDTEGVENKLKNGVTFYSTPCYHRLPIEECWTLKYETK